jgi:hypothetical protein
MVDHPKQFGRGSSKLLEQCILPILCWLSFYLFVGKMLEMLLSWS